MSLTMIHDRKKRAAEQARRFHEAKKLQKETELGGHLRSAFKMLYDKQIDPADALEMDNNRQVSLLEAYVIRLETEAQDFLDAFPDGDGRHAARWFRMERAKVLNQIVQLKIGSAQDDHPMEIGR